MEQKSKAETFVGFAIRSGKYRIGTNAAQTLKHAALIIVCGTAAENTKKEADKLSDGNVVVMLTTKGTVISIAFSSVSSSIQAENTLKFLIDKKKDGESKIARMICMWHGGGIDLPSYAFREALVDIDSQNLSAQILLNGLGGYVVKTVKATMPKGYKA